MYCFAFRGVTWEPSELNNSGWQEWNRPACYFVIKWSCIPKHDSGCGFFRRFAKVFFRKFAKVLWKQWGKRRCPWKPIAHTAPLHRQGSLETVKLCFSWWNYPNMALHLHLAVSQITDTVVVSMQFERGAAAQKWTTHNPVKEKCRFAKDSRK
jgi:hypothetical protein